MGGGFGRWGGVLFLLISREGLRFFFVFFLHVWGGVSGWAWRLRFTVVSCGWLVGGWFNGRHLDGGQAGDTTMEGFPGFLLLLGHGLMGQDDAGKRARQHGGR